jgi:TRAP-type C4-dicarboxylate transport system permease small subunit
VGEAARAIRSRLSTPQRKSNRWFVNAALVSLAFAFLLFLAFFLITVIPNAMYSSETGWTDYTPEQRSKMSFWYLILLICGVGLIFIFFYSRKRKYDLGEK